jgi:alcohol dehydrogenase class IV
MKKSFSHIHMPTFICGRGSISFVRTLNKERVAVVGYSDVVKEIATDLFEGTQTEVRYIATIDREPFISDLFDNLDAVHEFQPDMILAIGGGSVMDVAKGLCLFYENPDMSFEDSLKPFFPTFHKYITEHLWKVTFITSVSAFPYPILPYILNIGM